MKYFRRYCIWKIVQSRRNRWFSPIPVILLKGVLPIPDRKTGWFCFLVLFFFWKKFSE